MKQFLFLLAIIFGIHDVLSCDCPDGKTTDVCKNSCTDSCEYVTGNSVCPQYCAEGCFCPDGYVDSPYGCIKESDCRCPRLRPRPRCPSGMIHTNGSDLLLCKNSCTDSCGYITGEKICTLQCASGCFCPRGYVNSACGCIRERQCRRKPPVPRCPPGMIYTNGSDGFCKNFCRDSCLFMQGCRRHCQCGCFCPHGKVYDSIEEKCVPRESCFSEESKESEETKKSQEESGEKKDTKEESGEIKDTKEESGEKKDTKEESGEIKDTKEESGEIKDTKEESGEIKDTEEESGEIKDTKEESGEIKDTKEESGEIKDTKEESGEEKDTKEESGQLKESNEESGKMNETTKDIIDE